MHILIYCSFISVRMFLKSEITGSKNMYIEVLKHNNKVKIHVPMTSHRTKTFPILRQPLEVLLWSTPLVSPQRRPLLWRFVFWQFVSNFLAKLCTMKDLSSLTKDRTWAPLQWERGVLTTGPRGKSLCWSTSCSWLLCFAL